MVLQFMLIWYSNIPEEVTYFVTRIEDYNLLFFGMVAINFLFPLLILMNSDFKRVNWFVVTAGIFILIGHYLDIYVMVMPVLLEHLGLLDSQRLVHLCSLQEYFCGTFSTQ